MKRSSIFVTIFFMSLLGFTACATLNDYKAKTTDEEEIKTTLVKYFEAWENYDADSLLSVFHEDARIRTRRDGVVLSKKQYSEILPQRFKKRFRKSPSVRWGSPEINVRGDYASAYMTIITPDLHSRMGTILARNNGKWQIMSNPF